MKNERPLEGGLRTEAERQAAAAYAKIFAESSDSIETKLQHFAKYIRRQDVTRLLARYELFKRIMHVKGSIVECGVYRGFGLMTWANLSAALEPANLTRRIYGFDSFEGFPHVSARDLSSDRAVRKGELRAGDYDELQQLISAYDQNRFLGHIPKVYLIKGDAQDTIPLFVDKHPHLVVSLLFLDFDLYEPTKRALEAFKPRMPQGAVLAFDELDNPLWPGETLALLETAGINRVRLQRFDFDPYISFAVLD